MAQQQQKRVRTTVADCRVVIKDLEKEIETLKQKIDKYENRIKCMKCQKHKQFEEFYLNTDPLMGGRTHTPICKDCAKSIALRRDKNGVDHSPTKESVILALRYLNKPFLKLLWESSIQEANLDLKNKKSTAWGAYIKNIQMVNYYGMTFKDSDFFHDEVVYDDEVEPKSIEQMIKDHEGMDTYDSYMKNKQDVIRLLNYDPFEKEAIEDQPFLYSQLLGMLDSSEDANEDMMRVASSISIVRAFLQQSKLDDTIATLSIDAKNIEKNSATIKSLQDSKNKAVSTLTKLAEDSCISLKHNKNSKKGENTWTGKTKKLKELNLREGEVNGFDLETCRAMKQVMDLSNESIMKQLHLDESEWSDIVADQRSMITELRTKLDKYTEICRILLRENIDIKDTLKEQSIDLNMEYVNFEDMFSSFSEIEEESDEG